MLEIATGSTLAKRMALLAEEHRGKNKLKLLLKDKKYKNKMEGGDVKPPPLTSPWSRVRDADPSHNAAILMNVDAPVAIGDYSDRIFPASHRCCQLSNAGTERGHAHQRRGNNVISPFAIVDLIGLHLKHRAAQALCFCIAVTHYLVFFCPPSLLLLLQNK